MPEKIEDGIWCLDCKYLETSDEMQDGKCMSCGCSDELHVEVMVVVKTDPTRPLPLADEDIIAINAASAPVYIGTNAMEVIGQIKARIVNNVANVWCNNNGWIPGAAKRDLEEALGVPLPASARTKLADDGRSYVYVPKEGHLADMGESYDEWKEREGI